MKYIIEIEDVPFSKVRIDADNGAQNINLYRAKGFNSLVFDQFGLDKLTSLDKALSSELGEAYHKGFEAGSHEATTLEYQQGLNDAWEMAKRIVLTKTDANCPYFTVDKLEKIFGCFTYQSVFDTYSASEAIEKVKAYEEHQKVDDEIKVGDEVKYRADDCGVVTWIYGNDAYVLWQDGSTGNYAANELVKTGRHFNFLASLLNAMKEGAE